MLTDQAIRKLPNPARRKEIPDGKVRGLFLQLQPSGARSWALRYRYNGKPRKLTLGAWPTLDLAGARRSAQRRAVEIADGRDPAGEKTEAREHARIEAADDSDRVKTVLASFAKLYAVPRLRSAGAVEFLLRTYLLPAWGERKLGTITRKDVVALLDSVAIERPIQANRLLDWTRVFMRWARARGLIETDPCEGVKAPSKEVARDRVLSGEELGQLWRALGRLADSDPIYSALTKLLIVTGARLREIAEAGWSEISIDTGVFRLPADRSKNGRELVLTLPEAAIEIIRATPKIEGKFVFTLDGVRPISGFSWWRKRLDAEIAKEQGVAPLSPWRLHDLRRSTASGMAGLGIAPHVIEAILNHKSGTIKGIAAVYNRYSYDREKAAALAAWASHVEALASGKAMESNIVALRA
jgi:integrase